MTRRTISYSCTANFGEDAGVDQNLTRAEIRHCIEQDYEIENTILMDNDQGVDCDDAEVRWITVSIDCMEDRSSVEYTVTAQIELEDESESDSE